MESKDQETEVQSDVENMNKSFGDTIVEPEPEPEPDLVEDPPEIEPEEALEPEPESEPIKDEIPPEPVIPDPIEDDKDKLISDLREKLAEKESVPEPEPEPEPLQLEEQDFVGDLDLDELVREPVEFNKLLNKVFTQGIDTSRKILGEGILRAIPDIVKANIVSMSNLQKASEEFYKENKDLEPFKKVVATVFEEIASESPGKSYSELLPKVGDEVRNRLELHRAAVQQTPNPNPRLPRKRGRSTPPEDKPKTDTLVKELEDMSMTLGR